MSVASIRQPEESAAAILLRVREVRGSASGPDACRGPVDDGGSPGRDGEIAAVAGDDFRTDGEQRRASDRERKGLGERTVLRMKALQRRATEGVARGLTPRRLVGWSAVTMVLAGAGMIGIGIQQRLAERRIAVDDVDDEGFSETIVPGATYARLPAPETLRPSDGFATPSAASDVPGSGVIQPATFHMSSPSSPRGAWLAGTIEDDSEFAENVSHEPVGPRLR